MNRYLLAAAAAFLFVPAVQAQGNYTLSATASSFSFPSGTTSPLVSMVATNSVNPDQPTNFMTAWQFNLSLIPDSGAVGTLNFNSPATSTNSPLPPNYVFPGSFAGLSVTNNGTTLRANDFNSVAAGSQVPTAPGANLLQLNVQASVNANGTWGLFAVQGAANTAWTNAASTPQTLPFINVPLTPSGNLVRVGTFTVVPEPSLCLLAAAGGLAAWRVVRRRRY